MLLEDTGYDKNLTGNLLYEGVVCILCMEMGIASHLLNATLGSR